MQQAKTSTSTPQRSEELYILIEESEGVVTPSKTDEKVIVNEAKCEVADAESKLQIHKRLKKFHNAAEMYRRYQTKPGKDPKISELRQTRIPPKRQQSEVATSIANIENKPSTGMKSVWNPWILPEAESTHLCFARYQVKFKCSKPIS